MKGLLHRVAARAAGTTLAVRSDARLPNAGSLYAGGAPAVADVDDAGAQFPATLASLTRMPSASIAHNAEVLMRSVDTGDLETHVDATRTRPLVAELTEVAGLRDTATIVPHVRDASRVASQQQSSSIEPQTMMPLASEVSHSSRSALTATSVEPEVLQGRRQVSTTASATMRVNEPVPLMPLAPPPTPLSPVAPPSTRRSASSQGNAATQADGDTEVHIHIGRIDVTAVHEAPAPRRRTAAPPAPLSLDGYLAERGRK